MSAPPRDMSGSNMGTQNLRGFRWGAEDHASPLSPSIGGAVSAPHRSTDDVARGSGYAGPGDLGRVHPDGSVEFTGGMGARGSLARALADRRTAASANVFPGRGPLTRLPSPRSTARLVPATRVAVRTTAPCPGEATVRPPSLGRASATPLLVFCAAVAGAQQGSPHPDPADVHSGVAGEADAAMGVADPFAASVPPDAQAGDEADAWPPRDATIAQLETWLEAMRILPVDATVAAQCRLLGDRLAVARAALQWAVVP